MSAKAKTGTNTKKNKRSRKTKPKRKGLFNRALFKLVGVSALIGCIAIIFTIQSDYNEKSEELATVKSQIDSLVIENEELERILESNDLSTYMERIALEEGYAYPDERRFYDTSRNPT